MANGEVIRKQTNFLLPVELRNEVRLFAAQKKTPLCRMYELLIRVGLREMRDHPETAV